MTLLKHIYFPNISVGWCLVAQLTICVIVIIARQLIRKGKCSKREGYATAVLISYIIFVLIITVLSRKPRENVRCELRLFWSYKRIIENGISYFVWELVYNLLMFLPVGFLLLYIQNKKTVRIRTLLMTIMFGGGLSLVIEVGQFLLKRGMFEVDDILNNVISTLLGAFAFIVYSKMKDNQIHLIRHKGKFKM